MLMPDRLSVLLQFGRDEELKALGKMTILFASLDEAIAHFIEGLLASPALSALHNGKPIAELRFEDKQDLAKRLGNALASEHGVDAEAFIAALGEAKKASRLRNKVIHGWLTWDRDGKEAVFSGPRFRSEAGTSGPSPGYPRGSCFSGLRCA
jgi:hypothetical protein